MCVFYVIYYNNNDTLYARNTVLFTRSVYDYEINRFTRVSDQMYLLYSTLVGQVHQKPFYTSTTAVLRVFVYIDASYSIIHHYARLISVDYLRFFITSRKVIKGHVENLAVEKKTIRPYYSVRVFAAVGLTEWLVYEVSPFKYAPFGELSTRKFLSVETRRIKRLFRPWPRLSNVDKKFKAYS